VEKDRKEVGTTLTAIKQLLEAGDHTPGQLQMELRETDPIIRLLHDFQHPRASKSHRMEM
jgi:hypothetical protein